MRTTLTTGELRPGDIILLSKERLKIEQVFDLVPQSAGSRRIRARSSEDGCAMVERVYRRWQRWTVERDA